MKLLAKIFVFIFIFLPSSYAENNKKESVNAPIEYEQELTKLLSALKKVTGIPAFSVAVVHKGALVASVSTGYVDTDKKILATNQHLFRLASVSKVVGATMLAELVVNGRLDPDKPIGLYFPELDTRYHQITTRQLVSHTSGMPHYQIKDYNIYNKHYLSAIEAVETLKGRDLLSRPGEKYSYSTHGYTLAGAIHEKIVEQPLSSSIPSFVKRWTKKSTPIIENIENLSPLTSKLYTRDGGTIDEENFGEKSYSVFGAGLSATASDLAHLGYKVLSKSKSNEAYRQLLFTPTMTKTGKYAGNNKYQVGFGWRIGKDSFDRRVYHHAGATPGARSIMVIYPEQDLSITVLSNSSWTSGIDEMAFSLASLYIDKVSYKSLTHNVKYEVNYDSSKSKGNISCTSGLCFLANERSGYSKWLNKFNYTGEFIAHWPIFSYSSENGNRLLMVTKVGIRSLIASGDHYIARVGKNKTYSVKLLSQN